MRKTIVTSRYPFLPSEIPHGRHEQGSIGKNVEMIVVPAVEYICKIFGTIVIPSIIITLRADFLLGNVLLLFYKFSGGKYKIEWYIGSGV